MTGATDAERVVESNFCPAVMFHCDFLTQKTAAGFMLRTLAFSLYGRPARPTNKNPAEAGVVNYGLMGIVSPPPCHETYG